MNNRPIASLALAAAVTMALAGATAHAQQAEPGLDYSVRAGVGYSDNLNRNDGDPVSSMFYSLGGNLRYYNQQGRVDSDINLDLDWQDYEASGFDSQVWGNMRARVNYSFVPDRLVWVFQNDFGQGSRNAFSSMSPDNVENINYFTTGPQWTIRLGDAMSATLDAKYSNVWYEESPNNSDRYSGGLMLFRGLSTSSRAYVRANYEDVQFDSGALAPDFTQTDLLAGYSSEGARTQLTAEAGYSELETDFDKQDGPTYMLSLSHDLTAALRAKLRLGQEFNDAARDIRQQGDFGTETDGVLSNGQAYEDRYAEFMLRFEKNRTELSGGVRYNDQDYITDDILDRERLRFDARLRRQIGRDWSAYLDAQFESVDYSFDEEVDYDETELGVGFGWTPTAKLAFNLQYRYRTRPSSSTDSFDENFVWLRADWSPGGRR